MENKLTDNEIVKALEELLKELKGKKQLIVPEQGVKNLCYGLQNFLDLINRLQAEIERLKSPFIKMYEQFEGEIKAEAYKECIEKVEGIICNNTYPDFDKDGKAVNIWKALEGYKALNNLLKELVGEDK